MPIHNKKKIIFIHIPKCGGTSILSFFYTKKDLYLHLLSCKNVFMKRWYFKNKFLNKLTSKIASKFVKNHMSNEGFPVCHLPINKYKTHYNLTDQMFSNYNTFTIIRNPYTRFLSMYNFTHDSLLLNPEQFITFVTNILKSRNDNRRKWFQPQYYFLCDHDHKIIVKNILKYEHLDSDFNKFNDTFNFTNKHIPHLNKSYKKYKFEQFYQNKSIKDKVYDLYNIDFITFNYPK
jgi:hypothetical protein